MKMLLTDANIADGIKIKFCHQMTFIDNEKTKIIVEELCDLNGPFGQAEILNTLMGAECFCYFVEIAPYQCVNILEAIIHDVDIEELKATWGNGRRHLIHSLEKLVFNKEFFDQSIRVLFRLALAENEDYGNNATAIFCQLFRLHLSGTEVPAIDRLSIIDDSLNGQNKEAHLLALKAINASFEIMGIRFSGAEFQKGHKAFIDWQPKTKQDTDDYHKQILTYLNEVIDDDRFANEVKHKALKVFYDHIRHVASNEQLFQDVKKMLLKLVRSHPYLIGNILSELANVKNYDCDHFSDNHLKNINQLSEDLSIMVNSDLNLEIFVYLSPPFLNIMDYITLCKKKSWKEKRNLLDCKTADLAMKFMKNEDRLYESLDNLITYPHKNLLNFGRTIGLKFHNIDSLIDACFDIHSAQPEAHLDFIAALLSGYIEKHPDKKSDLLKRVINHQTLNKHLIYITLILSQSNDIKECDLKRISDALKQEAINYISLDRLVYSDNFMKLDEKILNQFLHDLVAKKQKNLIPIITRIIHNYAKQNNGTCLTFKDIFENHILPIEGIAEFANNSSNQAMALYSLYELLKYFTKHLSYDEGLKISEIFLVNLFALLCDDNPDYKDIQNRLDRLYVKKIIRHIFSHLGESVWVIVRKKILKANSLAQMKLKILLGDYVNNHTGLSNKKPILALSWDVIEKDIIKICRTDQVTILKFIKSSINLLEKNDENQYDFHPWITNIINNYPDKMILDEIKNSLYNYCFSGNVSDYYKIYLPAFDKFASSNHQKTRQWASENKRRISKMVESEQIRHEEFFIS